LKNILYFLFFNPALPSSLIPTYLLMNGASLGEMAEVLGHHTLAMVKRYAHAHTRGVGYTPGLETVR